MQKNLPHYPKQKEDLRLVETDSTHPLLCFPDRQFISSNYMHFLPKSLKRKMVYVNTDYCSPVGDCILIMSSVKLPSAGESCPNGSAHDKEFYIQWHLTNKCNLKTHQFFFPQIL
jgi:hypothetical protein